MTEMRCFLCFVVLILRDERREITGNGYASKDKYSNNPIKFMIMLKIISTSILLVFLFLSTSLLAQDNSTKSCACCTEAHRQFDFWLGDWKAYAGDQFAGSNHIIMMQDSCIIQENWTSGKGAYTGTSYNYYNAQTKKWHQTWIDNQGGSLELSGGIVDGKMVLKSETLTNAEGKEYVNRITWTPNADGTVRQHWEVTTDEGKSWTTAFDGLYKKADLKGE